MFLIISVYTTIKSSLWFVLKDLRSKQIVYLPGLGIRVELTQIRIWPSRKKTDPDPTLENIRIKPDPDPQRCYILYRTRVIWYFELHTSEYLWHRFVSMIHDFVRFCRGTCSMNDINPNSTGVKYSLIVLGGGSLHHVSVLTSLLVKKYFFLILN